MSQPPAQHYTAIITSGTYRVEFDGSTGRTARRPAAGLGYGWECIVCHRAEAAHYRTKEEARVAGNRHATAKPHDLQTVSELLAQLDADDGNPAGNVIGLLDHETQEARAFLFKATPAIHDLVMQLTGQLPPPPHIAHNRRVN